MKNAVVIGVESASHTARYGLHKRLNEWTIIFGEETSIVGGISKTIVHGDWRIDNDGHHLCPKSSIVNLLWKELMPIHVGSAKEDLILDRKCYVEQWRPDPEKEERVMLRQCRVSQIYFRHHFLDYPTKLCGIESFQTLIGINDKTAVWNVNTEQEYHEDR